MWVLGTIISLETFLALKKLLAAIQIATWAPRMMSRLMTDADLEVDINRDRLWYLGKWC